MVAPTEVERGREYYSLPEILSDFVEYIIMKKTVNSTWIGGLRLFCWFLGGALTRGRFRFRRHLFELFHCLDDDFALFELFQTPSYRAHIFFRVEAVVVVLSHGFHRLSAIYYSIIVRVGQGGGEDFRTDY